MRHLPPTAAPLSRRDWLHGWQRPRPGTPSFEQALASYLGGAQAFTAASGRTVLYLLLRALREREPAGRREVLLPAYTCPALVKVILDAGLCPRPLDISPATLDFRPEELQQALQQRPLALIYVHPFGLPRPVTDVLDTAQEEGVLVIEDAAQALGARLAGRPVGTWGDFGLFSLGPGKPLSTGGGGVLCARDEAGRALLAAAWAGLPAPGRIASALALLRLAALHLLMTPGGWRPVAAVGLHHLGNDERSWGYRVRALTAGQRRAGRELLRELDSANEVRRANATALREALASVPGVTLPTVPAGSVPIYLRLPVLAPDGNTRDEWVRRLNRGGIGAGRMYVKTLSELFPQLEQGPFPGAQAVARRLLTLPTHHYLTPTDVTRTAALLQ